MKLIYLFLFFSTIFFQSCAQGGLSNSYKITTYDSLYCKDIFYLKIQKENKIIYESCGGDGYVKNIDTTDVNQDGIVDFIYSVNMENYDILYILISFFNEKYKLVELGEIYYFPEPKGYENFEVIDFKLLNSDGKKKLVIRPILINNKPVIVKGYSKIYSINELLEMTKK